MKIVGCVEYDGSRFYGWQIQVGQPTIQEHLQKAISVVADHKISIQCAGRTDTGVHACGQVFHFETDSDRSDFSWVMGTNMNLPDGISLLWVRPVEDSFHARFSVCSRAYRYIILNRNVRPSYLSKKVGWYYRHLDISRMNAAAVYLVGLHDFSAFRSSRCSNKEPEKDVSLLEVATKDEWVWIDIEANGFLHHMVRNITGVLQAVGCGDQEPEWAKEVLESKDRTKAGKTVPADGLYFVGATYPDRYMLPAGSQPCRYW